MVKRVISVDAWDIEHVQERQSAKLVYIMALTVLGTILMLTLLLGLKDDNRIGEFAVIFFF